MPLETSVLQNELEIKNFLLNNYKIDAITSKHLSIGSANCFKIYSNIGVFFLKEMQSKFSIHDLERVIVVCNHLKMNGIETSVFLKNIQKGYVCNYKGHLFHLQKYIEGETPRRNCMSSKMLMQSSNLLARLHKHLETLDRFPIGFDYKWYEDWHKGKSIEKLLNVIFQLKRHTIGNEKIEQLIDLCYQKIYLLQTWDVSCENFKQLKCVNSHGDYNNLQLLCDKNEIKAVIDFTSVTYLPAVWELIRSYTFGAPECGNGNCIDVKELKKYIDSYLSIFKLPLNDIKNMVDFYCFHMLRSTYGFKEYLETYDDNLFEFALWRTNLCKYMYIIRRDITSYLTKEYAGSLE